MSNFWIIFCYFPVLPQITYLLIFLETHIYVFKCMQTISFIFIEYFNFFVLRVSDPIGQSSQQYSPGLYIYVNVYLDIFVLSYALYMCTRYNLHICIHVYYAYSICVNDQLFLYVRLHTELFLFFSCIFKILMTLLYFKYK
jgi:hypothetical protein